MATGAPNTMRVARAAARRALLAGSVSLLGRTMLAAGAAAVVAVGVMKAAGLGGSLWAVIGIACAGLVTAVAWTGVTRWSPARAARELDLRLKMNDRLSSGLAFAGAAASDGFAGLAIAEAERAAVEADVERAVPVRVGKSWHVWPLVMTGALCAAVYLPGARWAENAKAVRADASEERLNAAAQIATARASLESIARREGALASPEDLAALADLRKQLSRGSAGAGESLTRAAETVGDAARRMENEANTRRERLDAERERLARAVQGTPTAVDDPAGLAKALSKGDAAVAAAAVNGLRERAESMPREERERIARQLEEMAEQLDGMKKEEKAPQEEASESPPTSENVPGDEQPQGNTSGAEQPTPPPGDEAERNGRPQERNEPRGEERQPSGEKAGEQRGEQKQGEEQRGEEKPGEEKQQDGEGGRDQMKRLGDAMREAARDLREKKQSGGEKQERKDGEKRRPDGEHNPPQQPDAREGEKKGEEEKGQGDAGKPRPGAQQRHQPSPQQQGEKQKPGSKGQRREGDQREQERQPKPEPGAVESSPRGSGPQPTPGTQQTPDVKPGANSRGPDGEEAPVPRGAERDRGPDGAEQKRPESPEGGAGQTRASPESEQSPSPGAPTGLDRLEHELQKMTDEGKSIDRRLTDSRRLRDQAQRMLSRATPEQRRRLEDLAERLGGGGGAERGPRGPVTPPTARPALEGEATTPVDARPTPPPGTEGETIAQWLGEGGRGAASPRRLAEGLRRAADGAERSVEQQRVPARHSDLVRRVFERYMERAAERQKSTGGAPAAPTPKAAPDAPDAARGGP